MGIFVGGIAQSNFLIKYYFFLKNIIRIYIKIII